MVNTIDINDKTLMVNANHIQCMTVTKPSVDVQFKS